MNEMSEKADDAENSTTKSVEGPNETTTIVAQSMDIEDEKERAIAKAALSIAELGTLYNLMSIFRL